MNLYVKCKSCGELKESSKDKTLCKTCYPLLQCPHCGKSISNEKIKSQFHRYRSFKRWTKDVPDSEYFKKLREKRLS